MSGGGKGGSTTSTVKIPAWMQEAAQQTLARANEVSRIGYTPYYGPDVAALQPSQIAAMQNTNNAASAFGMAAPTDVMAGMPQAQQFAGGIQGYSSAPAYQQSVDTLAAIRPGQYNAIQSLFVDPMTGQIADQTASQGGKGGVGGSVPMGGVGGSVPVRSDRSAAETAALAPVRSGGGSNFASSQLASRLPGGVNTRDPGSLGNTVAAKLTSGTQRAPTSASRPAANPKR